MPSERLRLEANGFSEVTAYRFDQAVAVLANRIDQKSRETDPVKVPALPDPGKGFSWGQKPRYTMQQLLSDAKAADDGDWDEDMPELEALKHLPTAGL